jgi:hypothetical protein
MATRELTVMREAIDIREAMDIRELTDIREAMDIPRDRLITMASHPILRNSIVALMTYW